MQLICRINNLAGIEASFSRLEIPATVVYPLNSYRVKVTNFRCR
jgi:hypothetical protein